MAAREALATQAPAPLDRVLRQAAASRKFIAELRAKGMPDLPRPCAQGRPLSSDF